MLYDTHETFKEKPKPLRDKIARLEAIQKDLKDLLDKRKLRDNTGWIDKKIATYRQEAAVLSRAIEVASSPFS
jgi:hypothetical protein